MQPTAPLFPSDSFSTTFSTNLGFSGFAMFAYIGILFTFLLHIVFAAGAYRDACYIFQRKRGPFLVGPFFWALAVLVGGMPIVALYWAIHHSTLRPRPTPDSASAN